MRTHGGLFDSSARMLDFSANINPLGMPEAVRKAVVNSVGDCVHYPDPHCTDLIRAISAFEHIASEQIVCGNGAADLIYRIVHALQPKQALIFAPTFSEYAFALHEAGCGISEYALNPSQNYQPDESIISAISDGTDLVFLCTPNNPTGQRIPSDLLKQIAERCRETGTFLVSDECFLRFSENPEQYSLRRFLPEQGLILNAFTKLYAMPGLRLGYVLCGTQALAQKLCGTGQYWSVSVPAQAAGIAALQNPEWIPDTVRYVSAEREYLSAELRKLGITVYDSDANFLLIKAEPCFAEKMEQHGIYVRKCGDFRGLTDAHFRIAVRTHEENLSLITAVTEEYR